MSRIAAIVIILAIFKFTDTSAQKNIKWGKLSDEEINMSVVPFDSAAEAVILAKTGEITYADGKAQIVYFTRIKILSKNEFGLANVKLRFYSGEGYESIPYLQAQTINIKNGELVKTKVEKEKIFRKNISNEVSEISFTFPDITEGSIIEYKYTKYKKNLYSLEPWKFQEEYPIVISHCSVKMPISYIPVFTGRRMISKYKEASTNNWKLENVAALKEESFVGNYKDYAEKISFQYKEGATWESIASDFLNSERYISAGLHKKKIEAILSEIGSKPTLEEIYKYVQLKFDWNHYNSNGPEAYFSKFLDEKKGSAGSINYLLTLLLRSAGYESYPLLISTRSHGVISKNFPLVRQFNFLMTYVKYNGKEYFLDATIDDLPYNLTSKKCLNGDGFVLDHQKSGWVTIKPGVKSLSASSVRVEFDSLMNPTYHCSTKSTGQYAYNVRRKIKKDDQALRFSFSNSSLEASNLEIIGAEKITEPLTINFQVVAENEGGNTDIVYLEPFIIQDIAKNPFSGDERYYPIELEYPFQRQAIIEVNLPENYTFNSIPQSKNVTLPQRMGSLLFNSNKFSERKMTIVSSFRIKQQMIPAEYYKYLQAIYSERIAHASETIVIEKI